MSHWPHEAQKRKQRYCTAQTSFSPYFAGNITGNPQFTGAGNALNGNFLLQAGSPAISAGTHLTSTTGVGVNTNSVPVGDPYYFSDGYGIMPGDLVPIAGNPPVRVLAVNYTNNTLTVGATVS